MVCDTSNQLSWKNYPSSEGFNTHLCSFQEDRRQNNHFLSKPRQFDPQTNHLRKMSPVLRVSTHIYGVSKKIDGKTFIFMSKPWHVTPQIDLSWKNEPCSEGFNTHLWGFQEDRWENIHLQSEPRYVALKSIVLEK